MLGFFKGNKNKNNGDDFLKLVRINDRIGMDYSGVRTVVRIEDIRSGELHVGAPVTATGSVTLPQGLEVALSVSSTSGQYCCKASVKGTICDTIPIVVLEGFNSVKCLQRRRYERVRAEMPVRIKLCNGEEDEDSDWLNTRSIDISGSGLQIALVPSYPLEKGNLLEVEIQLPQDRLVKGLARVVRASHPDEEPSRNTAALQFANMDRSDCEAIVDTVRELGKEEYFARRAIVRCNMQVPVVFKLKQAGVSGEWRSGRVEDFGAGGVRVIVNPLDLPRENDILEICFNLPGGVSAKAECQVVWVHVNGHDRQQSQFGARYSAISASARDAIDNFVADHSVRTAKASHRAV